MSSKTLLLIAIAVFLSTLLAQAQTPAAEPAASQEAKATPPMPPQEAPPPEPLTPEKRGDIFMARKMHREAIEQYEQCPQTAVVLNKIGIAHHQMNNLETAKRYYERAIRKDKLYPEAVNNLGTIHYARRSYRRAVNQYQKALKLSPKSASIYSNLGTAWFARKKYKEAAEAYQQALALDPDVFEHKSSYGVLLQERNVEERAKFHYYLAKVYAKAGVTDRAILYIRKSLEEGFKDRQKYLEESEFAGLQELAEFKELMAAEPRVL
jgi:tetratricopeptide (TPR) repeat protein